MLSEDTEASIESALRLLRSAVPYPDTPEAAALRARLLPAIAPIVKRERQREKYERRQARQASASEAADGDAASATAPEPSLPSPSLSSTVDAVEIESTHLSRPLYPNPVCLLSTWQLPHHTLEGPRVNLMTISWLAPLDNAGRFVCSMCQHRFSAAMLRQNPYLVLSVPTAEHVPLLLRVGR